MKRMIACLLLFACLAPGRAMSGERVPTVAHTESGLNVSAPSAVLMERRRGRCCMRKTTMSVCSRRA